MKFRIALIKLSTRELAVLSEQVIRVVKTSQAEEAKNSLFMQELEKIYNEYQEAIPKNTYSGKGISVSEMNKARLNCFKAFKMVVEGFAKVEKTPQHQDAKMFKEVLNSYGKGFLGVGYAEQTSAFNQILKDFDTDSAIDKMKKMGLEPLFNMLKNEHEQFVKLYGEQAEANTELRKSRSATEIRKEMHRALRRFLDYVTLMTSEKEFESLYYHLNEYIKAGRRTIRSKEDRLRKLNS